MTNGNKERIQQIWVEITQWEKQKESGVSLSTQAQIDHDITSAKADIDRLEAEDQAAEQAEREQKVQANIATYTDTLGEIFEVLFPAATYEKALGLTEYGEKRTQYYQLQQAYYSEGLESVNAAHEVELAKKDERIQGYKDSMDLLHEDLTTANKRTRSAEDDVNHWIEKYNESERENVEITDLLNVTKAKLNESECKYTELEQRVLEANKQVLEIAGQRDEAIDKFNKLHASQTKIVAPGSTLKELLGDIKAKNQTEPDEWLKRFNERQKDDSAKLDLPEVPQQESPFQSVPATELTGDQLLTTYEAAPVEEPTFQITPPNLGNFGIPMAPSAPSDSGEGDQTPATQGWVNDRIAQAIADLRGEKVAS